MLLSALGAPPLLCSKEALEIRFSFTLLGTHCQDRQQRGRLRRICNALQTCRRR